MAGFFQKLINKFKDQKPNFQKIITAQNAIQEAKANQGQPTTTQFNQSLKKSASVFATFMQEIAQEFKVVDQKFINQLEDVLISFDLGPSLSQKILTQIINEIKYHNVTHPHLIKEIVVDQIFIHYIQDAIIDTELKIVPGRTNIILVMGANGVGKTTTIAKLANLIKKMGQSVLLVAADTFRAAAVEQLKVWANKLNVSIIEPKKPGQDPSSVIYHGITKGQQEKFDVVICDTSGRLENKKNLMEELKKIDRTIKRFDQTAPHETLLVLDATIGQSGLNQAAVFNQYAKISGLVLTKIDSTSKGGIVLAIKDAFNIPVKYVGYGEKISDLAVFNLEQMVDAITSQLE